jgi:hypothetical protein
MVRSFWILALTPTLAGCATAKFPHLASAASSPKVWVNARGSVPPADAAEVLRGDVNASSREIPHRAGQVVQEMHATAREPDRSLLRADHAVDLRSMEKTREPSSIKLDAAPPAEKVMLPDDDVAGGETAMTGLAH